MMNFKKELEMLINRYSLENKSNTPDYILADYINNCLIGFEYAIKERDRWYDFKSELAAEKERVLSGNPTKIKAPKTFRK